MGTEMREYVYDESTFPEYEAKVRGERKRAIQTVLAGVAVYFIFAAGYAFVLFPDDPLEAKVLVALYSLVIPISVSVLAGAGHWLNRRNPRRVTDDAILQSVFRIPLCDIQEVVWHGPAKGVEITLDPQKHRMKTWRIRGDDLLRPEEFLKALEGRVPVTPEDSPQIEGDRGSAAPWGRATT